MPVDLKTLGAAITQITGPYEVAQRSVVSRSLRTPPGTPLLNSRYIVGGTPGGAWVGHAKQIAQWMGTAWQFTVPNEGTSAWVDDENLPVNFNGNYWVAVTPTADPGDGPTRFIADEIMSPLRVVCLSAEGHVVYARLPEPEALAPLGITTESAQSGALISVTMAGPMTDPFWNWEAGRPVILAANGSLSQAQPAPGSFLVVIGLAVSPMAMIVRICPPILLAV